jgi:signal transduction histidine kinase
MNSIEKEPGTTTRGVGPADLETALGPGVIVLRQGEGIGTADSRALELLGCEDPAGLEARWADLRSRLEGLGLWRNGTRRVVLEDEGGSRRLAFNLRPEAGVLLVQDADLGEALLTDLRQSALIRSLSQITPAVAHDLRAPINAMVFNIEILKETIASGKGLEPGGRERQLRYVNVLREELLRLHREMEIFIAHISPRGDRNEILDVRELLQELCVLLTGPARKQQVQIHVDVPETAVLVEGNRYQLRQALLHLSLAVLNDLPREGGLELRMEPGSGPGKGNVRLRIAGTAAGTEPAPGFDLRFSPSGAQAQLWVAQAILAAQGGEAREIPGATHAYEVELMVAENKE